MLFGKRSLKSHPTPLLFSPWGDQKNKVNMLNYRKRKYVSHRWLMISVARNQFSYTGWVYKGQQLDCVGSSNLNWGRFLNSVIFKTGETTFRAPGDSEHRCTVLSVIVLRKIPKWMNTLISLLKYYCNCRVIHKNKTSIQLTQLCWEYLQDWLGCVVNHKWESTHLTIPSQVLFGV